MHAATLLVIENELVSSKRKIELKVLDFAGLLAAIRTELKLSDGEPIVVSKPVAKPGDAAAVALTTLEQIGAKTKVQVWLAAQFEAMCTVEAEPFGDEADAPVRVLRPGWRTCGRGHPKRAALSPPGSGCFAGGARGGGGGAGRRGCRPDRLGPAARADRQVLLRTVGHRGVQVTLQLQSAHPTPTAAVRVLPAWRSCGAGMQLRQIAEGMGGWVGGSDRSSHSKWPTVAPHQPDRHPNSKAPKTEPPGSNRPATPIRRSSCASSTRSACTSCSAFTAAAPSGTAGDTRSARLRAYSCTSLHSVQL